mgnify:CR=1 FL=1
MDLNQQKLTKTEWDTTEIPVSSDEKEILKIIIDGYSNVNIIYNKNASMINYLKMEPNDNIINHLHKEYFEPIIKKLNDKLTDLARLSQDGFSTIRKYYEAFGCELQCVGYRGSAGGESPWSPTGGRLTFLPNLLFVIRGCRFQAGGFYCISVHQSPNQKLHQ